MADYTLCIDLSRKQIAHWQMFYNKFWKNKTIYAILIFIPIKINCSKSHCFLSVNAFVIKCLSACSFGLGQCFQTYRVQFPFFSFYKIQCTSTSTYHQNCLTLLPWPCVPLGRARLGAQTLFIEILNTDNGSRSWLDLTTFFGANKILSTSVSNVSVYCYLLKWVYTGPIFKDILTWDLPLWKTKFCKLNTNFISNNLWRNMLQNW